MALPTVKTYEIAISSMKAMEKSLSLLICWLSTLSDSLCIHLYRVHKLIKTWERINQNVGNNCMLCSIAFQALNIVKRGLNILFISMATMGLCTIAFVCLLLFVSMNFA